jgi:ATP-dependent Clp protease adaptor protein ClpS
MLTPRRRDTDPLFGGSASGLTLTKFGIAEGMGQAGSLDWRRPTMATPGTETSPDIDVEEKLKEAFSRGWSVIVWNDPVNLMDYVVYVFKAVLKMNEKDASRHMWEVHQKGRSMVAQETREKSEMIVHRLRGFGLNATMEQA